jgi:competence protein ComEC
LISISSFVFASSVYILQYKKPKLAVLMPYAALLCAMSIGSVRLFNYKQPAAEDISHFVKDERTLATIRGVVISYPYTNYNNDWAFKKFSFNDPASSFYIKITHAKSVDGWAKVTGKVRVQVNEPVLDINVGDRIQIYCWLSRFQSATNPGQFDVKQYLERRDVHVGASVKTREGIELIEKGGGGPIICLRNFLYNYSNQALLSGVYEDNEKGLLKALLLGYRGNIDNQTYDAFRKTGLLHFISLSGMHLGILMALIWWLCGHLGLLKPQRAFVCIVVIILFLLIVPPREPTLRAAIVCLVFCVAAFFRRYPNPVNSLSLAAIILLLMRPTCLFEAGWQLSFASVLGILLFSPRLYYLLSSKLVPSSFERIFNPYLKILFSIWKFLIAALSTGFTAWLGGCGILLYHFYTINPFTCLWTVLVFPFVALALCAGYLQLILSLLFPALTSLLSYLLEAVTQILIWSVQFLSDTVPSEILIGKVPLSFVLLLYTAIIIIGLTAFGRIRMKKLVISFLIMLVFVSLGFIKGEKLKQDELVMTVLDVGHGQSIVLQNGGKTILFDAGSLNRADIGGRIVVPFLRYRGISAVDAVIISHQDIDHINGLLEIVKQHNVKKVYASRDFNLKKQKGMAGFLSKNLKQNGLDIDLIENAKLEPVDIDILWPVDEVCGDESLSGNDKSIVMLVTYLKRRILITSDIEQIAQDKIIELYPDLFVDVVIVPHHGSISAFQNGFLQHLGAHYFLISCGVNWLKTVEDINPENTYITPRDGAVYVQIDDSNDIMISGFVEQFFCLN